MVWRDVLHNSCFLLFTTVKEFSSVRITEVHGWRNKLGVWVRGCLCEWLVGDCFFSPNDISRLRRPKNVKFGTKVASSTRMMRALRFYREKELIVEECGSTCECLLTANLILLSYCTELQPTPRHVGLYGSIAQMKYWRALRLHHYTGIAEHLTVCDYRS